MPSLVSSGPCPHPMAMQGATSRGRGSVTGQCPCSHRILPAPGGERKNIGGLLLPQWKADTTRAEGGATVLPTELQEGTRGRAAALGQLVPPSRMSRAALLKRTIRLYGTIIVSARQPERFGVHPRTQPFLSAPSQPVGPRI